MAAGLCRGAALRPAAQRRASAPGLRPCTRAAPSIAQARGPAGAGSHAAVRHAQRAALHRGGGAWPACARRTRCGIGLSALTHAARRAGGTSRASARAACGGSYGARGSRCDHLCTRQRRDRVRCAGRFLRGHQRSQLGVERGLDHRCGRYSDRLLHFPGAFLQRQYRYRAVRCMHAAANTLYTETRHSVCGCRNLPNNQLSGSIPSSLGSLIGLTYLCVACLIGVLYCCFLYSAEVLCFCIHMFLQQLVLQLPDERHHSIKPRQPDGIANTVRLMEVLILLCVLKRHACLAFPQQSR